LHELDRPVGVRANRRKLWRRWTCPTNTILLAQIRWVRRSLRRAMSLPREHLVPAKPSALNATELER